MMNTLNQQNIAAIACVEHSAIYITLAVQKNSLENRRQNI